MSQKAGPITDYIKVSQQMLTDGLPLPTDVYIRLPSGQYLLVAKKGDKGNLANLHLIKEKKADLYIPKENYSTLVLFNLHLVDKTMNLPNVSPKFKLNALLGLTEAAFHDLSNKGAIMASVEKCKHIAVMLQKLSAQVRDFQQLTEILSALPKSLMVHSMAGSIVSLAIAEEMGITVAKALDNIVLGALLHDIGLHAQTNTLLAKPKSQWTAAEIKEYENHPQLAAEMLRDVREIPTDIISIVLEHHELSNGSGFPKRYRDIKINPLAKVVALADQFVELIYDQDLTGSVMTSEEAVNYIEHVMRQPFNKKAFDALKTLAFKKNQLKAGSF